MNVSKSIEEALRDCIIAGGTSGAITEDDCHFELFQDTDTEHGVAFPEIAITAAPDVPDGQDPGGLSILRRVSCTIIVATSTPDDRTRETLVSLYERMRSAIDDANTALDTFSSNYLPTGWFCNGVLVQDAGEPYFDEDIQIFSVGVMVEVCIA